MVWVSVVGAGKGSSGHHDSVCDTSHRYHLPQEHGRNPETIGKPFSDIINNLPEATLVIDPNGRVIAWNKAIEDLTGGQGRGDDREG